ESVNTGFERAKAARPPHFYCHERANEVRLGSIQENLSWVSETDWICEAIIEKMDAKKALFAQIEPLLRPDAMITTNTSGLQISFLAEGRSESFQKRFLGTHFFNPPRYLKLLELIPTDQTAPEVVKAMTAFLEDRVARRVVLAKDTPGFIANRYGMWSMFQAVHVAESLHLSVEQVDAITGPFIGRPRSGSFRLNDIVGLDIMVDIASNLVARCPNDPHMTNYQTPRSMQHLLGRGWIGDKAGQGYYRREGKEMLALDLQTLAYRNKVDVDIPSLQANAKMPLEERLKTALDLRDEAGEFLRGHLIPILRYANHLKEEISHNVLDFDRVMMWGFGWEIGPFAMIDAIGHERLGIKVANPFYSKSAVQTFKGDFEPVPAEPQFAALSSYPVKREAETYVLRDMGDGVTALSLKTKMGTVTTRAVEELTDLLSGSFDQFVLTSEARSFSVGFDLSFFLKSIDAGDTDGVDVELAKLQRLAEILERKRCVAAVFGHCLGGGFELALGCGVIAAHPETSIGFPEAKVGLIPAGRGTALMRLYNQHNAKRLSEVAVSLMEGAVAPSPDQARVLGYLRPTDVTVYHPDRLFTEAKKLVLQAKPWTRPAFARPEGPLVGMIDRAQDEAMKRLGLSDYDRTIGEAIKAVFAKTASYDEALTLERKEFLALCGKALTHARIKHMLETNKPLRN
ncbi:MAG TPA: 3-hydroxyacyl-CoA dehydrogenase NAD-binding domain-containing protein, partial [Fimbriimonadaceae bacterium]|nr:3-hydroxyacyl-CoA dehydrogenase NAD-binding domain-containing protein [Fimbriimonadaceae bacterium]